MIDNLWDKFAKLGLDGVNKGTLMRRSVLLNNQLSLVLAFTLSLAFLLDAYMVFIGKTTFGIGSIDLVLVVLSAIASLYFVSRSKYTIGKLFSTLGPPFFLIINPVLWGNVTEEYFLWFPYVAAAMSIMPHFVFSLKHERVFYYSTVAFYCCLVFFSDILLRHAAAESFSIIPILDANYVYYKASHLGVFLFVNLSVFYLIHSNRLYENQLETSNEALLRQAFIIEAQSEELSFKNQQLQEKQEQLMVQNEALGERQAKLQATLDDLKQMQSQLVQSEKMASLGVLTAGVAHEINNPINFISSGIEGLNNILRVFTEVLEACDQLDEANAATKLEYIQQVKKQQNLAELLKGVGVLTTSIQSGVDRTKQIIKGLRVFSHAGKTPMAPADLHENLDSTLALLQGQYKERIQVVKEYGDLPEVLCLAGEINQVFMNILSNAIHAIEGEGCIYIRTRYLGANHRVQVSIRDTGTGIPTDVRAHIFQPFYTTKEVGKGTGLGLSISYNIIKKHQGSIQLLDNTGPGSEFIIELPVSRST